MKLLVDVMCGGILAHLRMCGHDAAYALDRDVEDEEELLALARGEQRTLVTRNRSLADLADESIALESTDTVGQLREVADAGVSLELTDRPERCGQCNGRLRSVDPETTVPEYAPDPSGEDVWQCERCGQYFWKGSHWDRVAETLAEIE